MGRDRIHEWGNFSMSTVDVCKLRSVEADLITGLLELDRLRRNGMPDAYLEDGPDFWPDPADVMRRVLDAISPADLTYPLRVMWKAAQVLYPQPLTWNALLTAVPDRARSDCRSLADRERGPKALGMSIAYYTPMAAAIILRFRDGVAALREAQDAAARAYESMEKALQAVYV